MNYFRRSFGLIALLALLLPGAALAQAVSVSVNAGSAIRTVDERVFGVNAVIWDPAVVGDPKIVGDTQTITLLKAADLRAIRVPGGSLSDEYHWRLNKSIDRSNPTQNNTWAWSSGFDKFITLITGLNAQAMVTVNYGTGTPEEAAAWVAYANASPTATANTINYNIGTDSKGYDWKTAANWANLRGAAALTPDDGMNFLRLSRSTALGIKYWEIGNENYGSWETDSHTKQWDPITYATVARDFIAKMKAVDPSIKIGVVVETGEDSLDSKSPSGQLVTNPRTNVQHKGWTPLVLATLKTLKVTPDFVIDHRYEQAPASDRPGDPESDTNLLQKAKTWPADAADLRGQLTDYLGDTEGAGVEILVTENNSVYSNPGKQTTSLVNGLYYADSVGNLLQTKINSLMWWDLRNGQDTKNNNSTSLYGWRNYGDYGVLSSTSEPYPVYYVMKLLSKFARGGDTIVSATSNNSLLSVFAAKTTGGNLNLLVINKSPPTTPATSLTASIALAGYTPPAAANVYSYGIPQDDAAKPGGSGSTDIASTTMAISGATFSASFAPYSVTVISLDATAMAPAPAPVTPAPVTPAPTPAPSSGGGGGGGGAPSLWFVSVLALLGIGRWVRRR